ncbi:polysaccharide pyruvyl transferase family protein [Sunxiuqinia indica]|uniref:polysaccharide pyruvyl transferase family protein n=1 Tax=Sunxiuqinia indica TaxID=2692584 RepID=UPI00135AD6F1|nr:polysaccharide pyruvyl transferase family protein [Sunxiuqinia indica]
MINRLINKVRDRIGFFLLRVRTIAQIRESDRWTIFLFGCPVHPNLGDQAQTYCIKEWLKRNYPDHRLIEFNWKTSTPRILKQIKKNIKEEDIIFGHSGYFFFEPHRELPVYRKIAESFPNHQFIILPQTINLTDNNIRRITSDSLNKHSNVTLICRDEISFQNANVQFKNCKRLLYPDMVTSLIGKLSFSNKRDGILFCMRNDIEAYYKPEQVRELMSRLSSHGKITLTDTELKQSYWEIRKNRSRILHDTFNYFSQFKLVVTDRYHGTIFSLIANTPVVVLSSADHKLSSGVKWFPKEFSDYVYYAKNLNEGYDMAAKILEKPPEFELPAFFEERYFSKLKSDIMS